jgi:hypothetical protein
MGVTVHFEGRVDGDTRRDAAVLQATRFASENNWPCLYITENNVTLKRVINEQPMDYVGPSTGVELRPHQNSEPFRLEFDRSNFCQEYCKTQFAPVDIHVKIIELRHLLKPLFIDLTVIDEAEYFESGDLSQLQGHIDACFRMMEEMKVERPGHTGPHRLPSGRIVDLLSNA